MKYFIVILILGLLVNPAYAGVIEANFDGGGRDAEAMPNPPGFDSVEGAILFSDFMPVRGSGSSKIELTEDTTGSSKGQFDYPSLYEGDELWMRGYFYLQSPKYQNQPGTTYYISSSAGNNDNDGLTPDTAFRTVNAIEDRNFLLPGDTVLFKRGDSWVGADAELALGSTGTADNWIILDTYGEGDDPLFLGALTPEDLGEKWVGWNQYSGNIYYANTNPSNYINWWPNCVVEDETNVLLPKSSIGQMSAGTHYYDSSNDKLYIWCADGANPNTHTIHIAVQAPNYRGIITTNLGAQYILIKNLHVKYSQSQCFSATDDYVWFKNCTAEFAHSAGFYWIHYTGNPSYDGADYGRAENCIARRTCIGTSQAFTIEGSYTWLYDCLAEYNYMAGFDFLDYNEYTDCHNSGAVRCIGNQNGLRPWTYDPNFYIDGARYISLIDCISYDAGGDTENYHPGIAVHNEHPSAVDVSIIYI